MKDGYKAQKNNAFRNIAVVLLAAWLLVSAVFSVVVYFIELSNIVENEKNNEQNLLNLLSFQGEDYWDNVFSAADDVNVQIIASKGYKSDVLVNTAKSVKVHFWGMVDTETDLEAEGLISYDDLIESMTHEQYEEIIYFLKGIPYEKGKEYILVCTEFYFDNNCIKPKTVEIALNSEGSWYMSKDVIKTYTLNPKDTAGCAIYKMDNDHVNVIPTNFLLNVLGNRELIEDPETAIIAYHSPEKIASEVGSYTVEKSVAPFTYVYSGLNTVSIKTDTDTPDNADNTQEIYIRYAKRFNVLSSAIDTIGIGVGVILVFFICVCFLTYVMLKKITQAQTEEAQKRRELTNSLAHDIKTPLFIISGYAQNLKENINTEKRDHYVDRIIERTKEVNLIVHQILNLAKLDSPYFELVREDTNMGELINDILTDYASLPDNKTVKVTKKADCFVFTDKYAINRAIRNVIDNAVKYSDKQTVISIEYDERALSISNVASGIKEENIEHFTEAYYRADNSREKEGSGLGLSAVKSITDMHGFKLNVSLKENILTVKILFRHK